MALHIDHIALFAPSLETACAEVRARTGVEPTYGGEHSDGGTRNALLALGTRTYLEIVAPDPAQIDYPTLTSDWASICRTLAVPVVQAWCVATGDLADMRERLAALGIAARGPVRDSRRRPDGTQLEWELLLCDGCRFGTSFPFFIDWKRNAHPASTSAAGCRLTAFEVGHPDAAALERVFGAIDLEIAVAASPAPRFTVRIESPRGVVEW